MKKLLTLFVAAVATFACVAQNALSLDEYMNEKRMKKIEKISNKGAANTGDSDVDAFVNSSVNAAKSTVATNIRIRDIYAGLTTEGAEKPTAEDVKALYNSIEEQTNLAKNAISQIATIVGKAKDLGGLKAVKVGKEVVDAGNNWKMVAEEVADQLKAVNALMGAIVQ